MQTIIEAMGGTYRQEGDYLLPNIEAPECPKISVWGSRRRTYLREHNKALYTAMMLEGTLNAHLEEVDRTATEMYDRLISRMAKWEGITEQLKAQEQMAWVGAMNNIRNRAEEIVNAEVILA